MQIESTFLRAGVMARRIALLAVVALALGAGTFVLARSSVEQAPTAELSFNPDAAYHNDFNLSQSGQPSVAAAQSMLSDGVVLALLERVSASVSDSVGSGAHAIGNFRSRLDLTEPWLETLQVRYRDPDPRTAAVVANAVAAALAEGSPPARAPPARHGKSSARAAVPAWENPYRIMRLASVPPRILAEPLGLAAAIAGFFFAAGVFGGFLVWHRARQAAYAEAGVEEGIGFTLLPPLVAVQVPELIATRPEAAEVTGAIEPEEVEEPAGPVSAGAGASMAQLPFVFQMGQGVGLDAPFRPRPMGPEVIQATDPAPAAEIVPEALVIPREAEMPRLQRATAAEMAARSAVEPAPVDKPPEGEPEEIDKPGGMEGGRISLADPGAGDAVWSERILQSFAGTSIGQLLEAELRLEGKDRMPRRPPGSAGDVGKGREPRESERA